MTLSIQSIAKSLSRRSRRAIAALIITSSLISGSSVSTVDASELLIDSQTVDQAGQDAANKAIDYWIFSDDYCGWASVEALVAPYSIDPLAVEPVRPAPAASIVTQQARLQAVANIVDQTLAARADRERLADDLAALAAQEPVDVEVKPMIAPVSVVAMNGVTGDASPVASDEVVHEPAATLLGSSPVIVSIAEGYLPYDLSHNDQIALRMYPISIPQFNYIGSRPPVVHGPLDCLGHGQVADEHVVWNEQVLPSQSISTAPRPIVSNEELLGRVKVNFDAINETVQRHVKVANGDTDAKRRALALALVEAVQPNSYVRQLTSPVTLGQQAGSGFVAAYGATKTGLRDATQGLASRIRVEPKPQIKQDQPLVPSAGEKLLVRAGVEANLPNDVTAGVEDVAAGSVCCPVERTEVAAELPLTHSVAEVNVASATLSLPQLPQADGEAIARAEALATACDSAADTLERFALALRWAGDSVVRVARTSAGSGTELR